MASLQIDNLLKIQEIDLLIERSNRTLLKHPIQLEIDELVLALDETIKNLELKNQENIEFDKEYSSIEQKVLHLKDKQLGNQNKIDQGLVITAKGIESMQSENEFLTDEQNTFEERQLEIMEQVEQLQIEIDALSKLIQEQQIEIEKKKSELGTALLDVKNQLEAAIIEKQELEDEIPSELLEIYRKKRGDYNGTPIARFSAGKCEGCNMSLSSVSIDKVKKLKNDELGVCDECDRILVR